MVPRTGVLFWGSFETYARIVIELESARHSRDRHSDHPCFWLAPPSHCLCCGSHWRACHGAFQFFPCSHNPDDRRRLAHRRLLGDAPKARRRAVRLGLPVAAWRAFAVGWWWGFGYFVAGLWWLGAAFLVDADEFAWALPLGVAGLPAVLAVFPGLGFLLARLIWTPGAGRLFALAAD